MLRQSPAQKWLNTDCLHSAVRDGQFCAMCGAVVEDWRLKSLARTAAEYRELYETGGSSEGLYRVRMGVVMAELIKIGQGIRRG